MWYIVLVRSFVFFTYNNTMGKGIMIEEAFRSALIESSSGEEIDELWKEIVQCYSEPHRHYHTLDHLDNVVAELVPVRHAIKDRTAMVMAIAYHDIVYDVSKLDNEELSAELAYQRLTQLRLPEPQKETCKILILATKTHQLAGKEDFNLFVDADLAILGAPPTFYENYCSQIRQEHKDYPDELYVSGRIKVLNRFLKMSSIFKTRYFKDMYEKQARKNMNAEIKLLS